MLTRLIGALLLMGTVAATPAATTTRESMAPAAGATARHRAVDGCVEEPAPPPPTQEPAGCGVAP